MVAHTYNPSTGKAKARRLAHLRSAYFTQQAAGQSGLHGKTLTQKSKNKTSILKNTDIWNNVNW